MVRGLIFRSTHQCRRRHCAIPPAAPTLPGSQGCCCQPGSGTPGQVPPGPGIQQHPLAWKSSELSARECAALSLSMLSFCRARASSKASSASPAVQAGGGAVRLLHSQQVASTRSLHPSSATSCAAQSQRRLQHAHQAQRQAHPVRRRCSTAGTAQAAQAARQTQRAQRTLLPVVVVAARHGHSHQLHLAAAPAGQQGMQGMQLKRLVQQAHQAGRQRFTGKQAQGANHTRCTGLAVAKLRVRQGLQAGGRVQATTNKTRWPARRGGGRAGGRATSGSGVSVAGLPASSSTSGVACSRYRRGRVPPVGRQGPGRQAGRLRGRALEWMLWPAVCRVFESAAKATLAFSTRTAEYPLGPVHRRRPQRAQPMTPPPLVPPAHNLPASLPAPALPPWHAAGSTGPRAKALLLRARQTAGFRPWRWWR